jgi:hypothetical protein
MGFSWGAGRWGQNLYRDDLSSTKPMFLSAYFNTDHQLDPKDEIPTQA